MKLILCGLLITSFALSAQADQLYKVCGKIVAREMILRNIDGNPEIKKGLELMASNLNQNVIVYSEMEKLSETLDLQKEGTDLCVVGTAARGPNDEILINVVSLPNP